jgi:GDPmannose 4,6-dehydratase
LGNINAKRDWSDAEDCVDAVWRMLNQDIYNTNLNFFKPSPLSNELLRDRQFLVKNIEEYVVSSGESHSIREFVELAFGYAGIGGNWRSSGLDETFITPLDHGYGMPSLTLVKINPSHYRPAEVENLLGNSSRIRNNLGWSPKTSFRGLVEKMVKKDLCE